MNKPLIEKYNYFEKGVDWIHDHLNERQFLIFSSIMVGLSAGLAAVVLKLFVHSIRRYVMDGYLLKVDYKYFYLLMPLLGIAITVLIIQHFFKGSIQKGTVNILHAIARRGSFLPFRHTYAHIVTAGITVGFGGSTGLESPIVTTGSAIGSNYARRYKLSYKERTLLLAAGAAGGIAGGFNAPIAGILFALEVLLVDISITAFIPLLIASASGALISRIILGEDILLNFSLKTDFNYRNVPFYVCLGVIAGFVSLYHVVLFQRVNNSVRRIKSKTLRVALAGLLLAGLIAVFPSFFGEGYDSIKQLADMKLSAFFNDSILAPYLSNVFVILIFVLGALLIKAVAVGLTLGSGGNGGNFAPALFVGAYIGFAFAFAMILLGFDNIPVTNFILVSMAGTLCGIFHAPLTAIFLIAEITGGYELIIPLMIVSSISYMIVKYYHPESYEVKKLKKRGTVVSEDKDTSILGKIQIESLIETDFVVVSPDEKLRDLVEKIKNSKRNIFPVVNKAGKLVGIISLNNIRTEMFNQDLYDKISA